MAGGALRAMPRLASFALAAADAAAAAASSSADGPCTAAGGDDEKDRAGPAGQVAARNASPLQAGVSTFAAVALAAAALESAASRAFFADLRGDQPVSRGIPRIIAETFVNLHAIEPT